jgi:hypothetical protein
MTSNFKPMRLLLANTFIVTDESWDALLFRLHLQNASEQRLRGPVPSQTPTILTLNPMFHLKKPAGPELEIFFEPLSRIHKQPSGVNSAPPSVLLDMLEGV